MVLRTRVAATFWVIVRASGETVTVGPSFTGVIDTVMVRLAVWAVVSAVPVRPNPRSLAVITRVGVPVDD